MLPTSLEAFIEHMDDAPIEPELVQITTLGPSEIRELSPIFVIPGLSGHKELDEMVFELIYPTFWANLPSKPMPLEDLAQNLAEVCSFHRFVILVQNCWIFYGNMGWDFGPK